MRVLFASLPSIGHLYPLVPIAWAAKAAGHEVLFASFGESKVIAQAGMAMVDIAPDLTQRQLFIDFQHRHGDVNDRIRAGEESDELEGVHWGTFGEWLADGAVAAAQAWRPDLVVYERMAPFGLLAAAVLGVPAVRHQLGIDPSPLHQLRHMTAALERHGVPDLTDDDVPWIDLARSDRGGLPLRPVQYNGGVVLPPWLMAPRERPRIAITVGTIVPRTQGVGVVDRILSFASEFDADFVLAMEARDSDKLGTLPANVRAGGWLPMNALLPYCSAVVHHGGCGTMYAAIDAGVPQLLLPYGASDRHVNADNVVARGIGLASAPDEVTADHVRRLITDDALRTATLAYRAELAELPSPSEFFATLAETVRRSDQRVGH